MEVQLHLALTWVCPLCQERNFCYEPLSEADQIELLEECDWNIDELPDDVAVEPEEVTCAGCKTSFGVATPPPPPDLELGNEDTPWIT